MGADPAIKYVLWRGRFFGVTVNLVFSTLSTCARVAPKTAYILDIFLLNLHYNNIIRYNSKLSFSEYRNTFLSH